MMAKALRLRAIHVPTWSIRANSPSRNASVEPARWPLTPCVRAGIYGRLDAFEAGLVRGSVKSRGLNRWVLFLGALWRSGGIQIFRSWEWAGNAAAAELLDGACGGPASPTGESGNLCRLEEGTGDRKDDKAETVALRLSQFLGGGELWARHRMAGSALRAGSFGDFERVRVCGIRFPVDPGQDTRSNQCPEWALPLVQRNAWRTLAVHHDLASEVPVNPTVAYPSGFAGGSGNTSDPGGEGHFGSALTCGLFRFAEAGRAAWAEERGYFARFRTDAERRRERKRALLADPYQRPKGEVQAAEDRGVCKIGDARKTESGNASVRVGYRLSAERREALEAARGLISEAVERLGEGVLDERSGEGASTQRPPARGRNLDIRKQWTVRAEPLLVGAMGGSKDALHLCSEHVCGENQGGPDGGGEKPNTGETTQIARGGNAVSASNVETLNDGGGGGAKRNHDLDGHPSLRTVGLPPPVEGAVASSRPLVDAADGEFGYDYYTPDPEWQGPATETSGGGCQCGGIREVDNYHSCTRANRSGGTLRKEATECCGSASSCTATGVAV